MSNYQLVPLPAWEDDLAVWLLELAGGVGLAALLLLLGVGGAYIVCAYGVNGAFGG